MNPKVKYISVVLLFTFTFCNRDKFSYTENPEISDSHGIPFDSSTWYFPAQSLTQMPPIAKEEGIIDTFWHQAISKRLYGLNEPVLSNYYLGETIIRLTWIRSFHPLVVLRLTDNNGKNYLYENGYAQQRDSIKTTYGFYQEKINLIPIRNCIPISHKLYAKIDSLLDSGQFYKMPSTEFVPIGLDGSEWILEVHKKGKYHLIWRWSPETSDFIRKVGDNLLNMSSFRNEERY